MYLIILLNIFFVFELCNRYIQIILNVLNKIIRVFIINNISYNILKFKYKIKYIINGKTYNS